MVQLLAFSLQDQVEKFGAYIGIAAFFGLAVLTILYFAQARELRRLRDWAGRAPERAQEVEARAVAQAEAARRVQAQPQRAPAPATAGGASAASAATAAAAGSSGDGQATQVVEPVEVAGQTANGKAESASEGGDGEETPAEAAGNGDATGGAKVAAAAAKPDGEDSEPAGEGEAEPADAPPAEGEAKPEGEAAKPSDEAVGPAGEAPEPADAAAKPGDDAAEPAGGDAEPAVPPASPAVAEPGEPASAPKPDDDGQESAEIPVAPVPRATPLPRRSPAPSAPLRQPSRSATLPPRRPAPARRSPVTPAGSRGGGSKLVPALIGAGALAIAVVALFATGVLGGGEDPAPAPNTTSSATPEGSASPAELTPAATKVAVLNGTTIPGLASREKDALTDAGFTEIETGNNTDQQRGESSVLYGTRAGARAQARTVAQRLDIATVQRIDADTRDLSSDADVVVILGQDKAP